MPSKPTSTEDGQQHTTVKLCRLCWVTEQANMSHDSEQFLPDPDEKQGGFVKVFSAAKNKKMTKNAH